MTTPDEFQKIEKTDALAAAFLDSAEVTRGRDLIEIEVGDLLARRTKTGPWSYRDIYGSYIEVPLPSSMPLEEQIFNVQMGMAQSRAHAEIIRRLREKALVFD